MASTFTCEGLALPGDQDPLGVWELRPLQAGTTPTREAYSAVAQTVYGAAGAGPPDGGLVWTIGHPVGAGGWRASRDAQAALRVQLAVVEERDRALDAIEARLKGLDPMPAYGVGRDSREVALLAEITALQEVRAYAVPGAITSAGLRRQAYQQIERVEEARKLLAQLRRLVHHWAWIETQMGAEPIALTTIDWGGDYQTTWLDGVTERQMDLHLDAVRLAMASRHALLRLITVAVTGALELALKASVPGGQILLLPAVYRYIRDLLAELSELPVQGVPSWQSAPSVM
jgi:hypothetical protein